MGVTYKLFDSFHIQHILYNLYVGVVKYFRSGKKDKSGLGLCDHTKQSIKKLDFIQGPYSNGRYEKKTYIPNINKDIDSDQLCIINDDLADNVIVYLEEIIYFL